MTEKDKKEQGMEIENQLKFHSKTKGVPSMLFSSEYASPCLSNIHGLQEYTVEKIQLMQEQYHSQILFPSAAL